MTVEQVKHYLPHFDFDVIRLNTALGQSQLP